MIYSQVLWALMLDSIVWHVKVNIWTVIGVASVVSSLTLVSLAKEVKTSHLKDMARNERVGPRVEVGPADNDLEIPGASEEADERKLGYELTRFTT